jgi:hypothetical protein
MTPELLPEPESSRTLTAMSLVFLATPKLREPMVPATWVPWPWPSASLLSAKLSPHSARPSNSGWLMSMPVSTT